MSFVRGCYGENMVKLITRMVSMERDSAEIVWRMILFLRFRSKTKASWKRLSVRREEAFNE